MWRVGKYQYPKRPIFAVEAKAHETEKDASQRAINLQLEKLYAKWTHKEVQASYGDDDETCCAGDLTGPRLQTLKIIKRVSSRDEVQQNLAPTAETVRAVNALFDLGWTVVSPNELNPNAPKYDEL